MIAALRAIDKRFWLIVHEERAGNDEIEELVRVAGERGVSLELCIATEPGDGNRLALEGIAAGCDGVIAAGGDGTVNAVVNGLAGSATPLGIIPIGTANDFARQAGIPEAPLDALEMILGTVPVIIDTASLNGRHFLNVSTGGIGAEMTAETPTELKSALGPLAYAVTGIRKLANLEVMQLRVVAPGVRLECESLLFAVGNGRSTGGGNLLTPRASFSDGLLDVCIVEAMAVTSLIPLLLKLRAGEHPEEHGVHYFQAPDVTIFSHAPVSVNLDGEPMTGTTLEYRAHRGDLRVFMKLQPDEDRP